MSDELVELKEEDLKFLGKILHNVQQSYKKHSEYCSKIGDRYKNNAKELLSHLEPFIDVILLEYKTSSSLDKVISFLISLVTYRENGIEWIDNITTGIIRYLLKKENSKNKAIRLRVCDIIGKILKDMDENYEIDEDLWLELTNILRRRLIDKQPLIRKSAAFAIHRLQDVNEEIDIVRDSLIKMMNFDSNKDCRKEALKSLDLSRKTIKEFLRRIRDNSDDVRTCAFERLHQVDLSALSIHAR